MRSAFHPFLPNGLSGDPALWIDLPDDGRSILIDLGDLSRIHNRKLLRVDRVVVTHTHMDHFVGFDRLLRLMLRREREIVVTGPPGFLDRVRGRIDSYTWNLIDGYPIRLVAEEVDDDTVRSIAFSGAGGMLPEPLPDRPYAGTLFAERAYTAHVTELDHGIPVLGVLLREAEHLSVNKDRLDRLGLQPGPWLNELKLALRRRLPDDEPIEAATVEGGTRRLSRGELADEIIIRSPGRHVAYFCDFGYTEENVEKVVALARGVDLMICEAAFLERDAELARERKHLTARQAGELARAAGARRLAPFHISPRYDRCGEELLDEVRAAFGGPVVVLPPGPVFDEA